MAVPIINTAEIIAEKFGAVFAIIATTVYAENKKFPKKPSPKKK